MSSIMLPSLFCLLDPPVERDVLRALASAGVTGFQVRAKALSDAALLLFTGEVIEDVRPYGAVVVVNDRVDVALAAGADGVHLGRTDLPIEVARRLAPDLLMGATCRDRGQVEAAAREGADYVGFGPVFATSSKTGLPAPLGVQRITQASGHLPLIGIGGIDATSAGAVRAAGAHGVAVIGAIWRQTDPVTAAKELLKAVA